MSTIPWVALLYNIVDNFLNPLSLKLTLFSSTISNPFEKLCYDFQKVQVYKRSENVLKASLTLSSSVFWTTDQSQRMKWVTRSPSYVQDTSLSSSTFKVHWRNYVHLGPPSKFQIWRPHDHFFHWIRRALMMVLDLGALKRTHSSYVVHICTHARS